MNVCPDCGHPWSRHRAQGAPTNYVAEGDPVPCHYVVRATVRTTWPGQPPLADYVFCKCATVPPEGAI